MHQKVYIDFPGMGERTTELSLIGLTNGSHAPFHGSKRFHRAVSITQLKANADESHPLVIEQDFTDIPKDDLKLMTIAYFDENGSVVEAAKEIEYLLTTTLDVKLRRVKGMRSFPIKKLQAKLRIEISATIDVSTGTISLKRYYVFAGKTKMANVFVDILASLNLFKGIVVDIIDIAEVNYQACFGS